MVLLGSMRRDGDVRPGAWIYTCYHSNQTFVGLPCSTCCDLRFDAGLIWPDNREVPSSPAPDRTPTRQTGETQRQHILSVALSLMAQGGVDGTSMRDLASAAGLNVASLYHYFPSKRDLLVAVLEEQGFMDTLAPTPSPALAQDPAPGLGDLLTDILLSMLEVEDFIRLMLGEVMRGDETAHAVGVELFAATQDSLEQWLDGAQPSLCDAESRPAMARMLRAMLVGMFFEHVAGVLGEEGTDPAQVFRQRARESAAFFNGGPTAE
jgi:AcrR family transcriptional regulator